MNLVAVFEEEKWNSFWLVDLDFRKRKYQIFELFEMQKASKLTIR